VSAPGCVHVVVPGGIDDPERPSGGNTYDRRLCAALAAGGWSVRSHPVPGEWPEPTAGARQALARALDAAPDGSLVLVDGLVCSAAPEVLVPAARRLRVVVLMHMPLGATPEHDHLVEAERAVVSAAAAVVTTSDWCRGWLLAAYRLDPARVHVALPGVDPARPAAGSGDGSSLLCVGAVIPGKGHDVLLTALEEVAEQPWRCVCVGALTIAPRFVDALRARIRDAGLEGRVLLDGPRTGDELEVRYAAADVLVLASRAETYGMVVTEALARDLPVLATEVGGVPEALGATVDGRRPGLLSPPGDADALAGSLRRWLTDAALRRDLRDAARQRRARLTGWSHTAERVARAFTEVAA
jgi:glycosyltransferase involved in cell wall biosynthesis